MFGVKKVPTTPLETVMVSKALKNASVKGFSARKFNPKPRVDPLRLNFHRLPILPKLPEY
jgi:hypothetical protein